MSNELLKTLEENNISSDDYKNYAIAQEEIQQNSIKSEIKSEIFSWVVKGEAYSTAKNKIFYHEYKGKGYYTNCNN